MQMIQHCLIAIVFLVSLSSPVAGQVLNMDSIITQIDKNYPELQMYDAQIKAYDTYASGAKAWEAPQIGTGFFMTPYNPKFWTPNTMDVNGKPMLSPGMGMYMFQLQQMIPNPSRLRANQKYMKAMSTVEIENKNFMRNKLIAEARSDYSDWIVLQRKRKVLSEIESLLKYIIESSEIRYSYEKEKLSSIYKAKSELLKINNMQIMLENEVKEKMIDLNKLMNRDKDIQFDIDTAFQIKDYDKELTDTSAIASFRSDIRAVEKNIELARLKQQYEYTKGRPNFGIQYSHMISLGQNPNLFSLMGMVSIPIAPWSSRMYKANGAGLNFEMEAYRKQKEAMVNEVAGKLQTLRTQISNKKGQIKLYETGIIPALQKNYKTTLLAYEQNTEDLFVVLDSIENLAMTQIEFLNQLQELLQLQVEYEKEIEQQ